MGQAVSASDMGHAMRGLEDDLRQVMSGAMIDTTASVKADWRADVVAAGLGTKLANTVRSEVYPKGRASLDPAGWVWTKAPLLMDVYSRGATILPTDGRRFLAIPTAKVPRKGRRRMTPVEVEASFNQDLIIRPRGRNLLAFVDALQGRRSGTVRQATRRRLAQGRQRKLVLMFTLVPQVRVRKRLDLGLLEAGAAGRFEARLTARMAGIPDRAEPVRSRR